MALSMYLQFMYIHTSMSKPRQSPKTLRSDARSALETCAGWNLRLAARRASQFMEQRMAEAGVSFSQFGLMAEIASADDDTVSALAERMGLDQSTLSRTLRTLQAHTALAKQVSVDAVRRLTREVDAL